MMQSTGKLTAINISPQRGTVKQQVPEVELIENWGLAEDAHAGHWHRQVSLLSYEKIEEFRARGAAVESGAFGENLVISGFDLKNLPVGTRFQIGDALLEMTQIGKECHAHCEIYQRMGDCIMPREGVFAVVLRGGTIKTGDEVHLIPANVYATISDALRQNPDRDMLSATIVSGAGAGQKVYLCDGQVRFMTDGSCFTGEQLTQIWEHRHDRQLLKSHDQEIYIQPIGHRARLVICGGGHVSSALVRMAKLVGFEIWVLEDRPFFAQHAKTEGADVTICDNYANALSQVPQSRDNYYVCLTRGHRFDMDCLREIYRGPYSYIGMVGSKRRSAIVKNQLLEEGFPEEQIGGLHAPVGLDIGAQTPEEIAVSILGEIIQIRNETRGDAETDPEILQTILQILEKRTNMQTAEQQENFGDAQAATERMILCTIIEKHGSAPRKTGTQMLVTSQNRVIGTIGGGCAEAEVLSQCRYLFSLSYPQNLAGENENAPDRAVFEKKKISMSTDDVEAEGMVCGGQIVVLLEEI